MRILFIEDNPDFAEPTTEILESFGHSVETIDSADDAVTAIERIHNFDVVLLDVMLMLGSKIKASEANETGIAIYKRIRNVAPKMRIVFLSALSKSDIGQSVEYDQFTSYYGKPIPKDTSRFRRIVEGSEHD